MSKRARLISAQQLFDSFREKHNGFDVGCSTTVSSNISLVSWGQSEINRKPAGKFTLTPIAQISNNKLPEPEGHLKFKLWSVQNN